MDFGKILKKGKKIFNIKNTSKDQWNKCEACETRQIVYSYIVDNDKWLICADCLKNFVKDEK
jgi:ribosomal protein S27E